MNAGGAFVLCVLILIVLFGTRLQALLGIVCGVLFLSQAQQINLAGVNLFAIRFLEVAGCARVLMRREISWRELNDLDWALAWLYLYTTIVFLLRSDEGYASAIALAIDAGLCYLTFRGLIRNLADFVFFLRALPMVFVPYVLLLLMERRLGHVPLSFMSSGLEGIFIRDGVPRCMGSFRNPDLLGTVGATFLPCYIGLSFSKNDRSRAVLGAILCLGIVWLSHSGGSLSSAGIAIGGWGLWQCRTQMRQFRWGVAGLLVLLALVMKAPVWYLLDRISSITGGTGWHRAYLIDVAVRHLQQWWLAGMPIRETQDWFFYVIGVTGGADITNQYIWFGLTAGLAAMALLILVLVRAFSRLGRALIRVRKKGLRVRRMELMLWGLGVMLTVHLINWLGISYFDQIYVVWLLQLAALSASTNIFLPIKSAESSRATEGTERAKPVASEDRASPSEPNIPLPAH